MKFTRIVFHGKYSVNSQYLDTAIDIEAEIEEGNNVDSALNSLKFIADQRVKQWQQDARQEQNTYTHTQKGTPTDHLIPPGPTPIIQQEKTDKDKEIDELVAAIENCKTKEELSGFHILAGKHPDATIAYMNKMRELKPAQ